MEPQDTSPAPFSSSGNDAPPDDGDASTPDAAPMSPPLPPAGAPAPQSPRRGYRIWLALGVLLAVAVAVGTVRAASTSTQAAAVVSTTVDAGIATPAAPAVVDSAVAATPLFRDASAIGNAVIPSVATVQVGAIVNDEFVPGGSGSGIVYDGKGHVITNNHVVAAGSTYQVVLSDLRVYPAELVGTDPTTDLAVLAISATDLEPISLGESDSLTVGVPAIAVGSPLGLDGGPSLTVGVISAFGREVRTSNTTTLYGMLQTDAPITQGSSGGALVDDRGRLVGITTAVGVSQVGIEGIGFATPVEVITRVADEIIANGGASAAYLGIFGSTSFADTTDGGSAPVGVLIDTVEPDTGAAEAGLVAGDVVAAVDHHQVKTMEELIALLRRYGAGASISVTLDGGDDLTVVLGQRPDA